MPKSSKVPTSNKEELIGSIAQLILYAAMLVWLVLMVIIYVRNKGGVQWRSIMPLEYYSLYFTFGLIVVAYLSMTVNYFTLKGFNNKIETRVRNMFPRSNNADYANDLNLPVRNKIAT